MSSSFINCENITPKQASEILGRVLDLYLGNYVSKNNNIPIRKAVSIGKPVSDRQVVGGLEMIIPFVPMTQGRNENWEIFLISHGTDLDSNIFYNVMATLKANLAHGFNMYFQERSTEFDNDDQIIIRLNKGQIAYLGYKLGIF